MRLTNRANLPDALLRAMQADPYTKGHSDFSVTELLKPPRQRVLQKRHHNEIEEDVQDRLYSLYGQIAHSILERANLKDLVEKRFFAEFAPQKIVSAQIDSLSLEDGTLKDFKFTTAWAFKKDQPPKPEFVAQLNMQLEILRRNGLDANELQIIGLIRDFSKNEARFNSSYPQSPIVIQSIPMWPREATTEFIEERIRLHLEAEVELPECTPEERWAKPDVFAVMKGKRAIPGGLQSSLKEAERVAAQNPGTRVEYRMGESMRCELYCSANKFCDWYLTQTDQIKESNDAF